MIASFSRLPPARRAISLLEVLISIGILSVGLIGALSMIPVGRTYLTKAAVDDRAAAVIPAAYGELTTMGLMRETALDWIDIGGGTIPQPESEDPDPQGDRVAGEWTNDDERDAETVPLSLLDIATEMGRSRFVRSTTRGIQGFRGVDWKLKDDAEPDDEGRYQDDDYEVAATDDVDWYRIPRLEAGQILRVDASVPVTLQVNNRPLLPRQSGPDFQAFSIPRDGDVLMRVDLSGLGGPPDPANRSSFPFYPITLQLTRPDRVIAIDPAMATRLDLILDRNGEPMTGMTPLALRRRYFADFNQEPPANGSGPPRPFRIPRLSWQQLAALTVEQSVALADRLCRGHDDLEVDDDVADERGSQKRDEFAPPRPVYARDSSGNALARQAVGRMSWLLTLQPQAPGSVAANWRAGSIFDVSIVIFQDRVLPSIDPPASTVDGEYAFAAWWDPLQGMLFVEVPQPFTINGEEIYLDEEDLRVLFRTGSWMLLAPRVANDASPIEDRQRLVWARAQTVEMEKFGERVAVTVLPTTEPPPDLLLGTPNGSGQIPLVALVHEGVVAVVTKQMKVQGP